MKTKKKFPKISKDTLQETFIQVVTQLGEAFTRLDKLEQSVQGLIYTNADERLMKIESEKVVGVDDSEEVGELTHDEIESIIDMIRYTNNNRLGMVDMGYWNTIISKLFDLLDNRINEKRNKK